MQQVEYDCLLRFVEAVFRAEMGTDEHTFLRLRQLADAMHECPDHAERSCRIEGLIDRIDATDDGFYLPSEEIN